MFRALPQSGLIDAHQMNIDELLQLTIEMSHRRSVPRDLKDRVALGLPGFIQSIDSNSLPKTIVLPAGDKAQNATRVTAVKCFSLLIARRAFGAGYVSADHRYERLAKDVLFWTMRHHFQTEDPKGVFCCPTCTLSLLPLYTLNTFRWVDSQQLRANVIEAMTNRKAVFASSWSAKYAEWAKSIV